MGVFDSYGERGGQLKVGDVYLRHFNVGDEVNIPDGVYLTYVNVIVIHNGVFIAEFETLTSKWGESIAPSDFSKRAWFENLVEIVEQLNDVTHRQP